MNVYRLVERRRGKVYELVNIAPPLEGLARAFARAAPGRALDDLHQLSVLCVGAMGWVAVAEVVDADRDWTGAPAAGDAS